MRIWHLTCAVAVLSIVMALARDPVGRVFAIVFVTGLAEVVCGVAGLLGLFRTVGQFAEAKGFVDRAAAIAATTAILAIASALMSALLIAGAWYVSVSV